MIKRLRSKLHGAINPFPIILHEWYPAALKAFSDSVCPGLGARGSIFQRGGFRPSRHPCVFRPHSPPSLLYRKRTEVVFAHAAQTRIGVDLGGGDPLVPQKLLHLVQRHAGVQQEGRHAGAQPVRGHVLINARAALIFSI